MSAIVRSTITLTVLAVVLGGCGRGQPPAGGGDHAADEHAGHDHSGDSRGGDHVEHEAEDEHHRDHEHDSEGVVRLDEQELSEFGIRFAVAEPGVLGDTASLAGEVVLNPDRVAHVVARAGGIGREVRRTIGDLVEQGETLAILESPELAESKADYLSKAAQAALGATDLERAEAIHSNTLELLQIIADNPDVNALRSRISGLDIGANRGSLITAYAERRATEAIYAREKSLFERQISSESEYLGAESALKKALATFQAVRDDLAFANRRELDAARRTRLVADVSVQAAERRLHALGLDEDAVRAVSSESDTQLARYEIRAPIKGRIVERHLVRGESLEAGDQVFVIADLSSVWGQLTLYQRDLARVREGQTARVVGTHGLGEVVASIEYVSPILDEDTRTTTARVVLDNQDGSWRPGMFIRAELAASEETADVVVPRTAVQEIDGEQVIFVATEDGIARRDVRIGRGDSEAFEIVSGLRAGERYVVAGGLALKAELNRAALEHAGHAH